MLAHLGEVWVVTRANNAPAIEAALGDLPEADHLRFVYVDLPAWARFYKRGSRGARLYSVFWQAAALRRARLLDQDLTFDIVWHLTFSTAWLGSLVPLLPRPFVWGPIGGGVSTPWRLASSLGPKGALTDALRAGAHLAGRYANPMTRLAWRRACLILGAIAPRRPSSITSCSRTQGPCPHATKQIEPGMPSMPAGCCR
jgi:hypothetical protein